MKKKDRQWAEGLKVAADTPHVEAFGYRFATELLEEEPDLRFVVENALDEIILCEGVQRWARSKGLVALFRTWNAPKQKYIELRIRPS